MGRAFEFRKARKMKRWSAMSKAFTRIGKDIVIAGSSLITSEHPLVFCNS